ncbi:MAG: hypothetical protein ABSH56_03105 [Bryobacteraceae bacterium]|jgi:hypothetical protein
MASKTQDELLNTFLAVSGDLSRSPDDSTQALTNYAATGGSAAATSGGQDVEGGPITQTSSSGAGSTAESVATSVLASGFGVVPLIGGLLGLFGGGSASTSPPLQYEMPAPISFTSADTGSGLAAMDYDQTGLPRLYDPTGSNQPGSAGTQGGGTTVQSGSNTQASSPQASTTASPQVTVSVQAMDAQSFMDYSGQIANAVRSAMLNMSSLNDVVNDL